MRSMILATLGWGGWWVFTLVSRAAPSLAPPVVVPALIGCTLGAVGLLMALWSLRAQRAWILFTLAPLFANAALIAFPWIVGSGLRG
jgi:hypothetical protein